MNDFRIQCQILSRIFQKVQIRRLLPVRQAASHLTRDLEARHV